MSADSAEAMRANLPPAYRLVALETVASTNDEAIRLAETGAAEWTLVWAQEQTKGRGRQGRGFHSPPGNLYLSLILRPRCALAEAAQIGFVAGLALGDALGRIVPATTEITYKWPNDVLLNGRKAAGILLESKTTRSAALDWLILGVGANLRSYPEDTDFSATSLGSEGAAPDLKAADVLEIFSQCFLSWSDRWREDGFAPVRRAWLDHAHALGQEI